MADPDPRVSMRVHVETLFTLDGSGRLLGVNTPEGGVAPRFFLGRTAHGHAWWFRHDLDREMGAALEDVCRREPASQDLSAASLRSGPYEEVLREDGEIEKIWTGPTYRFPDEIVGGSRAELMDEGRGSVLHPYLSDWMEDLAEDRPFAVLLRDGRAVSLCTTVRRSASADEAGVETHPDFRGRGHAGEVVAAWARAVRDLGRTPLYSTSWTNEASIAVARKLGLIRYGAVLHIT